MALQVIDESYNGLNALYANAGEWVTGQVKIRNWYSSGSGTLNSFSFYNGDAITRQQGNWSDDGWVAGMTITIKFLDYSLPPPSNPVTIVKTITYINGNIMYLSSAVPAAYTNAVFPTSGSYSGMLITGNQLPEAMEFIFNLTLNGASAEASVIDGQVNRFLYNSVNTMAVTDTENMIQQNFFSGGLLKDVTITRDADQVLNISSIGSVTANVFTIDFKFLQWGLIQNGYEPPQYYDAADSLGTYVKATSSTENGNPNCQLIGENGSAQSNTGYRDENFNGGPNAYAFNSIALADYNGDPIGQIDYSNFTDFDIIIDAPNQSIPDSNYRIGLYWAPLDTTKYQDLQTHLGKNLLLNAPDVNFQHSAGPAAGPWLGYQNTDGARFDFSNLWFENIGGNQIRVRGRITPLNTGNETIDFFEQYPDGERRMVLWIQLGDYTLTGTLSDRVNLTVYDLDNFDAPTLGVQIPTVVSEIILDHDQNDITSTATPNTTTEDDVLYVSEFTLPTGTQYEGVRTQIWAYNTVTQEAFTLEEVFFDFAGQPYVSGQHEIDMVVNRGFLLAPTSDRNIIRLARKPSLDGGGQYGLQLEYGWLNRWEYWLAQANANNDFFVLGDPNNGLNKDWQHYDLTGTGDWIVRLSYYTRLNGVDDFNHKQIRIRPYEDNPFINFSREFTVVSNGTTPNELVDNELIEIEAVFEWTAGTYMDEWIELAIETFEGVRIGYMSSVLDHDGDPNNVMTPLPGETRLQVTIGPANIATARCYVDTNLFSAQDASLTYRIFSKPKQTDTGYIVTATDQAHLVYGLIKLAPDSVYPDAAPCIQVYRLGDGATQDIGFTLDGNGWLALDTTALLNFVNELGADTGLVKIQYDQSGFNNDKFQNDPNFMAMIVNAGSLVVDGNGKPIIQPDGVDDYYNLTNPLQNDLLLGRFLQLWGVHRAATGQQSVSLGAIGANPYTMVWNAANDIVSYMDGSANNHATGDTSTGYFLMSNLRDGSNDVKAWKNATPLTTRNETPNTDIIDAFGVYNGGTAFMDHAYHTLVLYTGDQEANRASYINILNLYYNYF